MILTETERKDILSCISNLEKDWNEVYKEDEREDDPTPLYLISIKVSRDDNDWEPLLGHINAREDDGAFVFVPALGVYWE